MYPIPIKVYNVFSKNKILPIYTILCFSEKKNTTLKDLIFL